MSSRQPWETEQRAVFRARFGEAVDAYDRTRPVAPAEVFDRIVHMANLTPGSSIVEIGPGTGQATVQLAERSLRVLALEIDARLAARTIENLSRFPDVGVEATSFETWEPAGAVFDAVIACNSFHWVDPDVRFVKSAAVLAPSGHLVVVATPVVVPDGARRFWWDVQDDWAAVGAERVDPHTKHPDLVDDLVPDVQATGLFEEPVVMGHPFEVVLSAREYALNLSTQSGVKELPADAQATLLERVEQRIDRTGRTLTVHHLAVVTVAKRAS